MQPGGQPNMQELLQQAQRMQQQLMAAQDELAQAEVQGSAGGGLVTVTVSGAGELHSLVIDPASWDAADPEDSAVTVADLVVAAVRDANRAAAELQAKTVGPLTQGLGGVGGPGLPPPQGF